LNSSNQKTKICAIIPFYNEKDFLFDVVKETLNFVDNVIAVNDGSTDGSEETINNMERVQVISLSHNYGKGFALQTGFNECIKHNYHAVITLDADKQHEPAYIPNFILLLNSFDVVIGNRLNNTKDMPIQRILSNAITSLFLTLKTGKKILDSQCGYRAYKSDVLQRVKSFSSGYEAESEMIIYCSRDDFTIGFVDISTIYGNEKSKINPFKAILGFLKIMFK
jgi:glycosyltransferase involved in cell wall biosynthesis